jgi:hypothetical protein
MTNRNLFTRYPIAVALILTGLLCIPSTSPAIAAKVSEVMPLEVELPRTMASTPASGRLLVMFAPVDQAPDREPRELAHWNAEAIPLFGIDIESWQPGTRVRLTDSAVGFPLRHWRDLPAGEYRVQALWQRYDTLRRADGRELSLPLDRGEGQQWRDKPGNLHSRPQRIRWDGRARLPPLVLTERVLDVAAPTDTPWVKYLRIRSERLSAFWGRDIFLGAFVTLPAGFHSRPQARYPLVIQHGHFPAAPSHWRETPPDPDLVPVYSARFGLHGYNRIVQQHAYELFQAWSSAEFPRVLLVEIQHPTPFYDNSYGVNSANNGPYGDAIQYELIPEIERRFRGLGQGWARFLFGGSAGGWTAMATQMFYPDDYNGAWIACPDPIDFRHVGTIDLYRDRNAYHGTSRYKRTPRPAYRNSLGHIDSTVEDQARWESALASRGRSNEQWDAWESVYSPVGEDGYPRRLWNRNTGEIDPVTAAHWRENYDLGHILRRDWTKLALSLRGKLRIYAGERDNYFLNNAVSVVEDFLRSAQPSADVVIEYGNRAEHCWNGDHSRANAYSRLRYPQMVLPWVVERILATAPPGADVRSWRY